MVVGVAADSGQGSWAQQSLFSISSRPFMRPIIVFGVILSRTPPLVDLVIMHPGTGVGRLALVLMSVVRTFSTRLRRGSYCHYRQGNRLYGH